MKNLITNRERSNVLYRNELAAKGFQSMTVAEKAEWLGDPFSTVGANLLPHGPAYSSAVDLNYLHDAIVATANAGGVYLYAISIIGESANYEGKKFTLSVDYMRSLGGGKPQLALYWHDDGGFEYAGASLTTAGSVTFDVFENAGNRAYLALYVYVTTDATVTAGATARFGGVMLESGSDRHEFVPYTEVMTTTVTKGAYNYSDLNRVERTVKEISEKLGLHLITNTDWAMWDIPRLADMERYLYNIRVIKNAIASTTSLPTNMVGLTYNDANNIEKILLEATNKIKESAVFCGDIMCGEV